MAYSKDFREQVEKVRREEDLSYREVAKRFGISLSSVVRWQEKPEPQKTRNKPTIKIDMEELKQDIEAHPDAFQQERADRLKVSKACIWYALKRLKVTYKKNTESSQGMSRKTICLLPDNRTA
jgi:hypothetical protein